MTIKQTILMEAARRKDSVLTRKAILSIWNRCSTESSRHPGGSFWKNLGVVSRSKKSPASMQRVDGEHYVRVNAEING